jgi:hypothetical protein
LALARLKFVPDSLSDGFGGGGLFMVGRKKEAKTELHPDAWARFERFIRDIAKAGP